MKEYELDNITLMGGWYIPSKICNDLIKVINNSPLKNGMMYTDQGGQQVKTDLKESNEIGVEYFNQSEPFSTYKEYLNKVVSKYLNKYPYMQENTPFALRENYNLQKYPKGGGFKIWHFENDFKSPLNKHRALVFMTYLNDVPDGGTEFTHQHLVTPAKKGLTLIWPAYWTHTHKGVISKTKEKYIATGWLNYINQL